MSALTWLVLSLHISYSVYLSTGENGTKSQVSLEFWYYFANIIIIMSHCYNISNFRASWEQTGRRNHIVCWRTRPNFYTDLATGSFTLQLHNCTHRHDCTHQQTMMLWIH